MYEEPLVRPLVLYVIQQHDYSGAEIMHLPVLTSDANALLACPQGSRTEAWAREHGIPVVPLTFRSLRHSGGLLETLRSVGRGLRSARELRRLLKRHPERALVFGISLRPAMLAGLAALGLRRRVVWSVTDFMPPAPLATAVRLIALTGCARAIALSEAVARDFAGRSRRLAARTDVVYPGTDLDAADTPRGTPGSPRAAVLGHVSPVKNTELALEVAARVGAEHDDFEVLVLGRAQFRDEDFEYERRLHERVSSEPALSAHVRFQGYAGDVAAELSRCGLLLHCRPDEPFGVALIEAMACGLPVVAPGAAGPAEIVEHGVTGYLFPPGDADEAARGVLALLADPELAARMGSAARKAVEERFTTAHYARQVVHTLYTLDSQPVRY